MAIFRETFLLHEGLQNDPCIPREDSIMNSIICTPLSVLVPTIIAGAANDNNYSLYTKLIIARPVANAEFAFHLARGGIVHRVSFSL